MPSNKTISSKVTTTGAIGSLCLALSMGGANAADLFTSMLNIQTTNPGAPLSAMSCQVLNVSNVPRSGTIATVRADGNVLSSVSYNNVAPGVGTGDSVSAFSNTAPVTLVYCHFTVTPLPGEKENVAAGAIRASLVRSDRDGNTVTNAEAFYVAEIRSSPYGHEKGD